MQQGITMITSFFPGRIRLRSDIFKDAEISAAACRILKGSSAVKTVTENQVSGSLLIEYDTAQLPADRLSEVLPLLESLKKESEKKEGPDHSQIFSLLDELAGRVRVWNQSP